MAMRIDGAAPAQVEAVRPVTLGWFLKRSIIGIAILVVAMGGLAWLTYASIDPNGDGLPAPAAAKEQVGGAPVVPVEL